MMGCLKDEISRVGAGPSFQRKRRKEDNERERWDGKAICVTAGETLLIFQLLPCSERRKSSVKVTRKFWGRLRNFEEDL